MLLLLPPRVDTEGAEEEETTAVVDSRTLARPEIAAACLDARSAAPFRELRGE